MKLSKECQAFVAADGYRKGYYVINSAINGVTDFGLLPSAVMLITISAELFAKCLHFVVGESAPRGHSLNSLVLALPRKERAALEAYFLERSKEDPALEALQAYQANVKCGFLDVLGECGDNFVEWRYHFEKQGPPFPGFYGVQHVAEAIRRRVLELRPEWKDLQWARPVQDIGD